MNEHPVARLPSLSHSYGIGSRYLSEMVCLHCSQGHSGFTLRLVLSSLSQPIHKLGAIEDTGPCDRRREQPHVHSQFLSELTQHLAFASLLFYANGKQLGGEKSVFGLHCCINPSLGEPKARTMEAHCCWIGHALPHEY